MTAAGVRRRIAAWLLVAATCAPAGRVADGGPRSPEVDAEGRVTFRYRAPDAGKAVAEYGKLTWQ